MKPQLPQRRKHRRRWEAFSTLLILVSLTLCLLGLQLWEIWLMLLLVIYLGWCLRR
jgi:fatty acid desaturase